MSGAEIEPEEEIYEGIMDAFVQVLIEIVKELEESCFTKEQFGRECELPFLFKTHRHAGIYLGEILLYITC